MRLSFLEALYKENGPFASVYLDTSRDSAVNDPEAAIELRWRHLRDTLTSEGADQDSLTAAAKAVGSDVDVPGPHGQAVFTAHGRLALLDELPDPPARDTAHFGTLPDTLPLIVQHSPGIPYVVAHVHYSGRHSTDATGTVRLDAEVGVWPLTKVTPGHRLHEEIPVTDWLNAAARTGRALEGHARRIHAEAVVVAGDVWARGILVRRLPTPCAGRSSPSRVPVSPSRDGRCWNTGSRVSSADAWPRTTGPCWQPSSPSGHTTERRRKALPQPCRHCNAAGSKPSSSTTTPNHRSACGSARNPANSPSPNRNCAPTASRTSASSVPTRCSPAPWSAPRPNSSSSP